NLGWAIQVPTADEGTATTLGSVKVNFWSTDTVVGTDAGKPTLHVSYGRGPGSACSVNSDCFFANGNPGVCAGGSCCIGACNDGRSCTTESCDTFGACTITPNNAACNDSNPCTT